MTAPTSDEAPPASGSGKDIAKLAADFPKALGLLRDIVSHAKDGNRRYVAMERTVKLLGGLVVLALAAQGAVAYVVSGASDKLEVTAAHVRDTAAALGRVKTQLNTTDVAVGRVQEEQRAAPLVEVVSEPDPVLAAKAPVKLRVTLPAPAKVSRGGATHRLPAPAASSSSAVDVHAVEVVQ